MPEVPAARPKPAVTRLWITLQTMNRVRDEYTRASAPADQLAAARAMADQAATIGGLVAELVSEAELVTLTVANPQSQPAAA